eukprot:9550-Eustigmatos_ZCMA.PRE.1
MHNGQVHHYFLAVINDFTYEMDNEVSTIGINRTEHTCTCTHWHPLSPVRQAASTRYFTAPPLHAAAH